MTDYRADMFAQNPLSVSGALSEGDTELLRSLGLSHIVPPGTGHGKPQFSDSFDVRTLQFDNRSVQSAMRLSNPFSLELDYTRVMMGFLLFKPSPATITNIGLGGGSLVKYCFYNLPSSIITAIEISADVITLRDRFMIPDDNPRLRVLCADGADFVRQEACKADVLLIDGFDINGQPPQLCSQKFYDDCYTHLAPDGILVANLLGKHHFCADRLRKSFGATNVVIVRTERGDNLAMFATKRNGAFTTHDKRGMSIVQGDLDTEFLPGVAKRIADQLARRDILSRLKGTPGDA